MAKKPHRKRTAKKAVPKRATANKPKVLYSQINSPPPPARADKLLLQLLQTDALPIYVTEPVIKTLSEGYFTAPYSLLFATATLATTAVGGVLTLRQEHASDQPAISLKAYVHNVLFVLRAARDELLTIVPPEYTSVVSTRCDRLIDTTVVAMESYMNKPLDQIVCENPKCKRKGRHLLPGPWIESSKRTAEAANDVQGLSSLIGESAFRAAQGSMKESNEGRLAVVLNEKDVEVLRFLADQRVARPRVYVADNIPKDRVSVGSAVKRLIQHGFVEDRGRNTGVVITSAGRAWIATSG